MRERSFAMHFAPAALAAVLLAAGGFAQAPPGPPRHQAPPFDGFDMLGFDARHGDKVVKGSPLSAVAVSENTQVLGDGTRIHRQTSTALYRDGQGRSRKEVNLPAIGPLAPKGDAPQFVMIHDPVAGERYILRLNEKTANKMSMAPHGPGGEEKWSKTRHDRRGDFGDVKTESLGTRTIEGVSAEGTRRTRTIPAGEIGNDKPIDIVSEVWYSADLQMVVMTRRSDPRFGETTYKLTKIQRAEPPASLFQVPSDFTVQESKPWGNLHRHRHSPPPPPPPPPGS